MADRTIHINNPTKNMTANYCGNKISTAKYSNVLHFLYKFLKESFSKYANVFFLFTSCIQQIPGVSPTSRFTTIIPLSLVLLASAVKEIFEDFKRHRSDDEVNNRVLSRLDGNSFSPAASEVSDGKDSDPSLVRWTDLRVGDFVRVSNNEFFPADLVLISSSEPDGLCYIETSNLDGETNLKIKQAKVETSHILSSAEAVKMEGVIKTEMPNNSLYTFEGTLQMKDQPLIALDPAQLLLRGAMLRNSTWIYGIVVFTGHESKLLRNSTSMPIKQTAVERMTNTQIVLLFVILLVLSFGAAIGSLSFNLHNGTVLDYIYPYGAPSASELSGGFFLNFLTFIILFNNLIPISLIVTMEVAKVYQAYLINSDLDMYYEDKEGFGTPAQCRTSSLVEELGQIQYVFSDKTGTLTCNEMEFRKCSVGGVPYSLGSSGNGSGVKDFEALKKVLKRFSTSFNPATSTVQLAGKADGAHESILHEFMNLLAVCHTVIPELVDDKDDKAKDGKPKKKKIVYQASSPDEAALVKAAQDFGYNFHTRRPKSVIIDVSGKNLEYEVLNVCEFNSTRKRMSTLVRGPDGLLRLLVKGADTVILERLKGGTPKDGKYGPDNPFVTSTLAHLEDYATEGLRTLCVAMRFVTEEEYRRWVKVYDEAATSLTNRSDMLDAAAEMIEKDLLLLGATAIEDKLQDGVPDAIANLAQAGIKLWVLTGDRQETAINIGYSCRLLDENMNVFIVSGDTEDEVRACLEKRLGFFTRAGIAGWSDVQKMGWLYLMQHPNKWRDVLHEWGLVKAPMPTKEDKKSLLHSPLTPGPTQSTSSDQADELELSDSFALVIDGKCLALALKPSVEKTFLKVATRCKSVICCRVSPLQKALVVGLVKKFIGALTLAIGDGANDVGMIQAAHVGVGISGHEGLQAARSADFAISQFRYLKKLLLVHGAWSYQRLSKLILYSFYKNITLYMTQVWFAGYNGFSGQTIYESWTVSLYNVLFTILPPFAIAIFDQFLSARMLERFPQLYKLGQTGEFFNVKTFWGWTINAFYHSLMLYYLVGFVFAEDAIIFGTTYRGATGGHWYTGTVVYTCVLATVLLKASLVIDYWTKFTVLFIPGSFLVWLIFLPIYAAVGPYIGFMELGGIGVPLFGNWSFWFVIVIVPLICLSRDFVWKYYKRQDRSTNYHIVQEIQKYGMVDYGPHAEKFVNAVQRVRMMQRVRRTRGFAFSQNESGQADLIRHYDTTLSKPTGQ